MATKTAAMSTTQRRPARRTRLTNTNTDLQCCDTNSNGGAIMNFLQKSIYRMNLWTGLYMLNPYERATFHIVGWIALVSFSLYVYVFWKGFVAGLSQQE